MATYFAIGLLPGKALASNIYQLQLQKSSRARSILLLASGCNCKIRIIISIKCRTHLPDLSPQEEGYNLSSSNILLSGASAGALSATLARTGISPYDAST